MSSTRVTINGLRHYNCRGVSKPLPSVTSILSATQSDTTRQKLAAWNALNPGMADQAAERGTWVHGAVENYVRGLAVNAPQQYLPYWENLPETLDQLFDGGKVLWSEKPLNKPEWLNYVGEDGVGRIHYYDAEREMGWAGCCDVIYKDKNGETILGDFKTSVGPYALNFPKKDLDIPEKIKKALISGVFKAKKTQLQLAAYTIAAEDCFGIKIDKTQIVVATPTKEFKTQVFTFGERELEKHKELWWQVVNKFYGLT